MSKQWEQLNQLIKKFGKYIIRFINLFILFITIVIMYYTISIMASFFINVKISKHLPPLLLRTAITIIFIFLAYSITHYTLLTIYSKYILILFIGIYIILLQSKISDISQIASIFIAGLCILYILVRFISIITLWNKIYLNYAYHGLNIVILLLLIWLGSSSIYNNRIMFSSIDQNISPPFPKYKKIKKIFGDWTWYIYFIISCIVLFILFFICILSFSAFSFFLINAHIFLQNIINNL